MTQFLYKHLLKPVVFQLDPEVVHNSFVTLGHWLGKSAPTRFLTQLLVGNLGTYAPTYIGGIVFPNQVGLSAGFDYNGDLTQILPSVGFGFATLGTVTRYAYGGNPKPRLTRYPRSKSLLVNKGLKSIGAVAFIKKLRGTHFTIPIGISIASTNRPYPHLSAQIADIMSTFALFEQSTLTHSYYELNISCPNTFGGQPFTTPARLRQLLTRLDKVWKTPHHRPVFVKMPIDLSWEETDALLRIIADHSISGVVFGNLTKDKNNPAVHPADREQWLHSSGNLSGFPTRERSNALIKQTRQHFGSRFIIIGTGGIFSAQDAVKKIKLGADLVQLITGMIYEGPHLIPQVAAAVSISKIKKRT